MVFRAVREPREEGRAPVSALSTVVRMARCINEPNTAGRVPCILLNPKINTVSKVMLPKPAGIVPVSLFWDTEKYFILERDAMEFGRELVSLLKSSCKCVSAVSEPIEEEIEPIVGSTAKNRIKKEYCRYSLHGHFISVHSNKLY